MRPPLRIAVLECDSPPPNADAKYGGYGGIFKRLLNSGAEALREPDSDVVDLLISKHNVQMSPDSYPNIDDIDAILISGSSE